VKTHNIQKYNVWWKHGFSNAQPGGMQNSLCAFNSEGHACGNRFVSVQNPNLKPVTLDSTSLFWICLTTLSVDKII
jgi:hypothetical protein